MFWPWGHIFTGKKENLVEESLINTLILEDLKDSQEKLV